MANLSRYAKEASYWSKDTLTAYNITVCAQDAEEFFGRQPGPIDHLDPNLLSTADPASASSFSKETYRFLAHLNLANRTKEMGQHDFARSILEVVGFDEVRGTILRTCLGFDEVYLRIFGEACTADMDVALVHLRSSTILLFVHLEQDSTHSQDHPEPALIAKAIAAFQHNNELRKCRALDPLDNMTIPCIAMVGTRPSFYKVPVTLQLSDGVNFGKYPSQPTVVTCCALPVPHRMSEGMVVPEYRRTALEYYSAFHVVAKQCWASFLVSFP
jgi:hypothetical protein